MARYLSQFPVSSGYKSSNRPDHAGVDIACPTGTPLPALVDGTVVFEGLIKAATAGYRDELILILQASGYFIVYGHLSATLVNTGQKVKKGDIIARSGNTGYVLPKPRNNQDLVSGAHLHIERRAGTKAANKPLSAYTPQDITPQLNSYGSASGGAEDMTYEQYAEHILDIIEDDPHYKQTKKQAFDGHVAWLKNETPKNWAAPRTWAKGIMANNKVLNRTYMAAHLQADVDFQKRTEDELSALSQKEIAARVDLARATEVFDRERLAWNSEKASVVNSANKEVAEANARLIEQTKELADLQKQYDRAVQNAKDVARWSWQEHLQALIQKLFGKGGE